MHVLTGGNVCGPTGIDNIDQIIIRTAILKYTIFLQQAPVSPMLVNIIISCKYDCDLKGRVIWTCIKIPLQDVYVLQRKRSESHACPMTSALVQTARTKSALVKAIGQHHLKTRLSATVSIKQKNTHNKPFPLYYHATWWTIMGRNDSGKRTTGLCMFSELLESLNSIIIHQVNVILSHKAHRKHI